MLGNKNIAVKIGNGCSRSDIISEMAFNFFVQTEPHFGTDYEVEKIPDDIIKSWKNCGTNPAHKLPTPNDLIDREMTIVQHPQPKCKAQHSLPGDFTIKVSHFL